MRVVGAVPVPVCVPVAVAVRLDLVEHEVDVGGGAADDASAEEPFGVGGRGDERRYPRRRQRLREADDRVDECGPLAPFRFDAVGGVIQGLTECSQRAREFLVPPGQVGTERIDRLDQRNLRAPAAIEFLVQPHLHRCRELRQSRVYLGLDLCPTSSTPRHAVPLPQPVEHHRECSLPAHSRGKHPDRDRSDVGVLSKFVPLRGQVAAAPRSWWWCRISCTVWRAIHSTERSAGSG